MLLEQPEQPQSHQKQPGQHFQAGRQRPHRVGRGHAAADEQKVRREQEKRTGGNADAGVDTDSGADTNADADECAADEHAAVRIANLAVDGRPIADDDLVIIASNSYLLQGGDSYPAFRAGTNYGELDMPYSQPLHEYLAAHQGLTAVVAVPVGTQA